MEPTKQPHPASDTYDVFTEIACTEYVEEHIEEYLLNDIDIVN